MDDLLGKGAADPDILGYPGEPAIVVIIEPDEPMWEYIVKDVDLSKVKLRDKDVF